VFALHLYSLRQTQEIAADESALNVSGTLHKLPNHVSNFGSTDAICIANNRLVTSGYDIDNGLGYINGIVWVICFQAFRDMQIKWLFIQLLTAVLTAILLMIIMLTKLLKMPLNLSQPKLP